MTTRAGFPPCRPMTVRGRAPGGGGEVVSRGPRQDVVASAAERAAQEEDFVVHEDAVKPEDVLD